jgi:hypothetical protein
MFPYHYSQISLAWPDSAKSGSQLTPLAYTINLLDSILELSGGIVEYERR